MGISSADTNYFAQIGSGVKLANAADNAVNLSIVQGEKAQVNGYDMAATNASMAQGALDIADGAYGSIVDYLQQMRELAVKASNSATVNDGDRATMQVQIDQLKQGISDIVQGTEYNTVKLLDGSNDNMYIQTGANANQGQSVSVGDASLQSLGIADFDVTGDFDIDTIDKALLKVNADRTSVGAKSNSLDHTIGYNTLTSYNLSKTISEKEDTDVYKAVTEQNKKQLLQTVQFIMQKNRQIQDKQGVNFLL